MGGTSRSLFSHEPERPLCLPNPPASPLPAASPPPANGDSRAAKKGPARPVKNKYVYLFGNSKADGNGTMKPLLGGKGANLAEMTRIGLPVPPGFTITTEVCTYYYANKRTYPAELHAADRGRRPQHGKDHGHEVRRYRPPCRCWSPSAPARAIRCPGMMDTILNLGLNDQTVLALAKATGNERFAWDCYRRFIQMYGDVVMGVQKRPARGPRAVRDRHPHAQARALPRRYRGHEADRRRPQAARLPLQGARQGAHRQAVPERSVEAARRRHRRRLRLMDERPRHRLPPQIRHPRRVGHRRQRPGHGLRQHRRQLRLRRRLHPRPGHRRKNFLRRIPHQRPGRGRRRRRPHARARGRSEEASARTLSPSSSASARCSRPISRTCRTSSSPSRTARSSCSRPATASAPASPPSASPSRW